MIQDSDLLNNYEKSLKEANEKLKEAQVEIEKSQEYYNKKVKEVSLQYNLNLNSITNSCFNDF